MEQLFVWRGKRAAERGYALLSLLAALTITIAILASAVPSIQHEMQRAQEEEMFWRGRQIATNLAMHKAVFGEYPLTLEELTKPPELMPANAGGKFRLRPSALLDPMTNGDWVPLRRNDARVIGFLRDYLAQITVDQRNGIPQAIEAVRGFEPRALLPSTDAEKELRPPEEGPIIGVVSRSKKTLIRTYYGAKSYDQAFILTALCVAFNPQDRPITVRNNCALKLIRMPTADTYLDLPLGELPASLAPQPVAIPPK
ncbi:MAG: hypothetical protein U0Y68_18045 [Blastocatellia bacterium]